MKKPTIPISRAWKRGIPGQHPDPPSAQSNNWLLMSVLLRIAHITTMIVALWYLFAAGVATALGKFMSADSHENIFALVSIIAFAILAVPHRWLLRPRIAPFGLAALILISGLVGFRAVFAVRNSYASATAEFGWIWYCSFFVIAGLNAESARRKYLAAIRGKRPAQSAANREC